MADPDFPPVNWKARLAATMEQRQRRKANEAAVRAELARRRAVGKERGNARRLARQRSQRQ